MEQNQQSTAEQYSEQIEQLMELGRTQGYLTYAEINDKFYGDVVVNDEIEALGDMEALYVGS